MLKYKPDTAAKLAQRFLEPGDAVLEIGAADGAFTRVYAKRVGSIGCVMAVEPNAFSRQSLKCIADEMPWVTARASAVGATPGRAKFYVDRYDPKWSSLYPRSVHQGSSYVVPMTTIDELVQSMGQAPDLIHVDAQGAEAAILMGSQRTLQLPIVWIVEVWPTGLKRAGATVDDVLQPFVTRGYQPETTRGASVSWDAARRACETVGRVISGHLDLVMVPAPREAFA